MNEYDLLRKFTLYLSKHKGIGPKTFKLLLEKEINIENLYKSISSNKYPQIKLDNKFAEDAIFNKLKKLAIEYKCLWEEDYPINLKQIADPPIILYYKGVWDNQKINNTISVVGTRKVSDYGKRWGVKFASNLTSYGYSLVSGMAFGVDRIIHNACINSNGYTIAILASSVDNPTPQANSDLYYKILDSGGLILSEFHPDVQLGKGLFPSRNRIIAGISLGTLVIEADIKSGALITASLALGYDREVFAIPGNLDNDVSRGCNLLIKEARAKLVQSVDDITVEFSYLPSNNNDKLSLKNINDLSFVEKSVYNTILTRPKLIDEISTELKLNIEELISVCSVLELKGYIIKDSNSQYFIN